MPRSKFHQVQMAKAVATQNVASQLAKMGQGSGRIDGLEQKLDQLAGAYNELAQVVIRNDALDAIERRINDKQQAEINAIVGQFTAAIKSLEGRLAMLERLVDPKLASFYVGQFLGAVRPGGSLIQAEITNPYIAVGLKNVADIRNQVGPRVSPNQVTALLDRLKDADPDNAPSELELSSLIAALHAIGGGSGGSTPASTAA